MTPILRFLPFLVVIHWARGAVVDFSYVGIGETMDVVGNPILVSAGVPEVGSFSFTTDSSIVDRAGLSAFTFSTYSYGSDFLGNPVGYLVLFGIDDLISFSASISGGQVVGFSFIAETQLEIIDTNPLAPTVPSKILNLRFVADENGFGSLAEVELGQATVKHEGPIAIVPEPNALLLTLLTLPFLCVFRH